MGIQSFPAALQPIIQQGFLEREFQGATLSRLGYRATATREELTGEIGATITDTRNTGLGDETFTVSLLHYASTMDLNMVTNRVGIASQFLQNAYVNGEQAARSLDDLARLALMAPFKRGCGKVIACPDKLTMGAILDGIAYLRLNAVPDMDGAYNCYLDPISARQLFADQDFRRLFLGHASANDVFRPGQGVVNDFLGVRFVLTNETQVRVHPTLTDKFVRGLMLVGKGALIEADLADMEKPDVAPTDSLVSLVNDICMVTREPVDRLQQIIAQSWYWVGGFSAMTDAATGWLKRAVLIEHVG